MTESVLDLAVELGYQLQLSGGEIYRVEESVQRLLAAYGLTTGEVFAIPSCLIVSVADADGHPQTRVRRVPSHGTDIARLEAVNGLCRRLCAQPIPSGEARRELDRLLAEAPVHSPLARITAYFGGAAFFTLFFGGLLPDALCAGVCGVGIGVTLWALDKLRSNYFVRTMAAATVSALLALLAVRLGLGRSLDLITIGALMSLVPGTVLTDAVRDIMVGDMVSGLSKLGEAVLIAIAIALGTGIALALSQIWGGAL